MHYVTFFHYLSPKTVKPHRTLIAVVLWARPVFCELLTIRAARVPEVKREVLSTPGMFSSFVALVRRNCSYYRHHDLEDMMQQETCSHVHQNYVTKIPIISKKIWLPWCCFQKAITSISRSCQIQRRVNPQWANNPTEISCTPGSSTRFHCHHCSYINIHIHQEI